MHVRAKACDRVSERASPGHLVPELIEIRVAVVAVVVRMYMSYALCVCVWPQQQQRHHHQQQQVVIWVQSAPDGPARERFAVASTTTMRIGVVLYGLSITGFLLSFGLLGFGAS